MVQMVDLHAAEINQPGSRAACLLKLSNCLGGTVREDCLSLDIHSIWLQAPVSASLRKTDGIEHPERDIVLGRCPHHLSFTEPRCGLSEYRLWNDRTTDKRRCGQDSQSSDSPYYLVSARSGFVPDGHSVDGKAYHRRSLRLAEMFVLVSADYVANVAAAHDHERSIQLIEC